MEANADAVRLVKPYVEAAIAAAISSALTTALTADDGAIKTAISAAITAAVGEGGAVTQAIATHAALTTGVHGLS